METPDIFIDWTYFELVPSRRKRGPRFFWRGTAPDFSREVIVACKDNTGRVIAGDSFDLETGAFEISPTERVRFWAYGNWMEELKKTKEKK